VQDLQSHCAATTARCLLHRSQLLQSLQSRLHANVRVWLHLALHTPPAAALLSFRKLIIFIIILFFFFYLHNVAIGAIILHFFILNIRKF